LIANQKQEENHPHTVTQKEENFLFLLLALSRRYILYGNMKRKRPEEEKRAILGPPHPARGIETTWFFSFIDAC